ncbi:YgfZ-like folate-binding protein [Chloropicon primus]|uniref:YgfZ-like folate-binding protein n=1 Tax=Chloropicon primus TaxID=1764295 RepID=A0A5B8ML39_9CHLO|nr:YgfZ-like folate-binding protein [Chloropicon primus]UPR00398.1 YgfZ-like folate-binding protein [Chloropicon primus]|eukprot:QDZ21186.1 YgfZ-like folate-binding protein [Chloropicon primus]
MRDLVGRSAGRAPTQRGCSPSCSRSSRRGKGRRASGRRFGSTRFGRSRVDWSARSLEDIDMLEVDGWEEVTLREIQEEGGAVFAGGASVPTSFAAGDGNEGSGLTLGDLESAECCVFCDRSDSTVLQVAGGDRLAFLHNQSTASVEGAKPGDVVETAFVTSKAGLLDVAKVLVQGQSALVLASPDGASQIIGHLDKHIFPRDDVRVSDVSFNLSVFAVLGAGSSKVMETLGMGHDMGEGEQVLVNYEGYPLCVARTTDLGVPGYTWIVDTSISSDAWSLLTSIENVRPIGSEAYERLRILAGRPAFGKELTLDSNPLEAGLYERCVDVEKGCSIGQEVIKRVHNRNGITRRLGGFSSDKPLRCGDEVLSEGRKVGSLTSVCQDGGGSFLGMGYVKVKPGQPFSSEGKSFTVRGEAVAVRALVYPKYPQESVENKDAREEEESLEEIEEAKEKKKEEMKARMEEWLKQQSKNK